MNPVTKGMDISKSTLTRACNLFSSSVDGVYTSDIVVDCLMVLNNLFLCKLKCCESCSCTDSSAALVVP